MTEAKEKLKELMDSIRRGVEEAEKGKGIPKGGKTSPGFHPRFLEEDAFRKRKSKSS